MSEGQVFGGESPGAVNLRIKDSRLNEMQAGKEDATALATRNKGWGGRRRGGSDLPGRNATQSEGIAAFQKRVRALRWVN